MYIAQVRKVYLEEWEKRYADACQSNSIMTIDFLYNKKKEIDEKGYFEEHYLEYTTACVMEIK